MSQKVGGHAIDELAAVFGVAGAFDKPAREECADGRTGIDAANVIYLRTRGRALIQEYREDFEPGIPDIPFVFFCCFLHYYIARVCGNDKGRFRIRDDYREAAPFQFLSERIQPFLQLRLCAIKGLQKRLECKRTAFSEKKSMDLRCELLVIHTSVPMLQHRSLRR